MSDKKGGSKRKHKKESYTAKFRRVNGDYFPNGSKADWRKIKEVR